METIPWFNSPSFQQTVVLERTVYNFAINYNVRDESWYLSIYDKGQNPLLLGRRLVVDAYTNILDSIYGDDKPSGRLLVNAIDDNTEITRQNMGTEVQLIYVSEDELL